VLVELAEGIGAGGEHLGPRDPQVAIAIVAEEAALLASQFGRLRRRRTLEPGNVSAGKRFIRRFVRRSWRRGRAFDFPLALPPEKTDAGQHQRHDCSQNDPIHLRAPRLASASINYRPVMPRRMAARTLPGPPSSGTPPRARLRRPRPAST